MNNPGSYNPEVVCTAIRGIRQLSQKLAANRGLVDTAYHWAMTAIQRDDISKAKYHALRRRGHKHARALRNVADRLLGVVCKTTKTGQTFDPEK